MKNFSGEATRSRDLHRAASNAFDSGDYLQSETLYRAAIQNLTVLLDVMHESYVDMLKGLLVSLNKQQKENEATKVRQLIAQLCQGQ